VTIAGYPPFTGAGNYEHVVFCDNAQCPGFSPYEGFAFQFENAVYNPTLGALVYVGVGLNPVYYLPPPSLDYDVSNPASVAAVMAQGGVPGGFFLFVEGPSGATDYLALSIPSMPPPPVISGMPSPGCSLWPPNGKLVQVATVTAADSLSGGLASFKVTGTSNEPSNDPSNPEIVITPNGSGGYVVQLQADRLGTGTGRIYTLTATASNTSGITTTSVATCTVPHDQGKQ
jgi:hypothetical protein